MWTLAGSKKATNKQVVFRSGKGVCEQSRIVQLIGRRLLSEVVASHKLILT